jgi:hypothetical protein
MDQVYGNAKRVIIYLGEEKNNSQLVETIPPKLLQT